ncbi:hypothetical protein PRIPAC_96759 [Pristionchus pacificus]|uniref:Uncharacterized protein n=1 Tax=Pristionchus pacificus TaxID=54126 RepID=A0A2A6B2L6_PRIPA|nr:hypothetical protein PRIPAC_96759 [Pristionchus pacificus]|eukprot:PDM60120.1 hypothetical protein PRIPAC_49406 [Pristionchus pacificus]
MPGNLFALSSIYKKEGEDDEFMPWMVRVDGGESYWPQWRLVKEDGSQYGERFALILRKINQEEDHLKSVDVSWVSGPPRSFRILQKKSIEAPTGAKLCYAEELEELTDHNYNLASSQKMLGKRKRKCYECGHADETTRTFPSNSRTTLQKQWLDRLGLDRQETIEKYEEYREKLGKGVDIRWCSKHFNTGETLPIDLRLKPLLATTPLREKLQPHRLNLRYRNHTMCSTPAVSDNEIDITIYNYIIISIRNNK